MQPAHLERLEALAHAYGLRSYSAVMRMLIDQAFASLPPEVARQSLAAARRSAERALMSLDERAAADAAQV